MNIIMNIICCLFQSQVKVYDNSSFMCGSFKKISNSISYILKCNCYTLLFLLLFIFLFFKNSKYLVPSLFSRRILWEHHCKWSLLHFMILLMVYNNIIYFNIQNLCPATLINFTNSNYFVYSLFYWLCNHICEWYFCFFLLKSFILTMARA